MKLEGEAGRDVIRYIKQEGAPSIELCPRERLVSEATGQVDACERACAPAYRNSPLEPYGQATLPLNHVNRIQRVSPAMIDPFRANFRAVNSYT